MIYWFMKYVVIGPIVKAIFRPWIVGRTNVPVTGAAILASNHLSVSDSIFLPLMIDRPVTFLAKSDYFTGKGVKGWATRVFMKATGQLPKTHETRRVRREIARVKTLLGSQK